MNDAVLDALIAAGFALPDPGMRRVSLETRELLATEAGGRASAHPGDVSDDPDRRRAARVSRP